MERVQFQQEQMLPELNDLEEKGIFTKLEVKQILKKRTAFETSLVRRVARKSDYIQYVAYEMQLEALRRKRVRRLRLSGGKKTISDYALVRRQLHILERAVGKFKDDVALWVQYIKLAQREGARTLAGKLCARALRLHPTVPALYVLAAAHELAHLSPATARTLLQRGLRLNGESVELWREYLRMELVYADSLRKRWDALGVARDDQESNADGEKARQEVLDGGIACTVVEKASKAVPTVALFEALQAVLLSHPWGSRGRVMDALHACLGRAPECVRSDARSVKLKATRTLGEEVRGAARVEAVAAACDALATEAVELGGSESAAAILALADFTAEWAAVDGQLTEYLVARLERTLRTCGRACGLHALRTHVDLVRDVLKDGERARRIAVRYGLLSY